MMHEKDPTSLYAFIEKTARMLRAAAASATEKNRKFMKETSLSNKNKIQRIARMLRSEIKKKRRKKL